MLKMFSTMTFTVFMAMSTPLYALEETAQEILDTCLSESQAMAGHPVKSVRYGLCLGYLKGIGDAFNGTAFCLPETGETAKITQYLKQTFLNYALPQKDQLQRPALQVVIPAFQKAFPCPK